jgi:hypothetical protein
MIGAPVQGRVPSVPQGVGRRKRDNLSVTNRREVDYSDDNARFNGENENSASTVRERFSRSHARRGNARPAALRRETVGTQSVRTPVPTQERGNEKQSRDRKEAVSFCCRSNDESLNRPIARID